MGSTNRPISEIMLPNQQAIIIYITIGSDIMPRKYEFGEKEKIIQLYEEGMAVSKISQIMCRHISTIKKILAE